MILGIDPGASGALALLAIGDKGQERIDRVFDMPTHEIKVNGKTKRRLDLYQLARWVDLYCSGIELAVIEDVHSMPGQGVVSVFSFGFAAGAAQQVVASACIPTLLVSPAKWKNRLGLTADKDGSRRLASMKFPDAAHNWARVKDDGRAEAALLAHYGALTRAPLERIAA